MKIQIDTTAKTIRVEQSVKFAELITALDALLPDNGWREFELLSGAIQHFGNPIVIQGVVRPWYHYQPYVTYDGFNLCYGLNAERHDSASTIASTAYSFDIQSGTN